MKVKENDFPFSVLDHDLLQIEYRLSVIDQINKDSESIISQII